VSTAGAPQSQPPQSPAADTGGLAWVPGDLPGSSRHRARALLQGLVGQNIPHSSRSLDTITSHSLYDQACHIDNPALASADAGERLSLDRLSLCVESLVNSSLVSQLPGDFSLSHRCGSRQRLSRIFPHRYRDSETEGIKFNKDRIAKCNVFLSAETERIA
jgi:hypothetical protein